MIFGQTGATCGIKSLFSRIMRVKETGNGWLLAAAALFAAASAAIWACAPVMKEDVAFREMLRYFNGGSDGFSPGALWDYILCQRAVDNGRAANILSPLSTLYGGPLAKGVLGGISLSATCLFLTLIARGRKAPGPADLLLFGGAAAAAFFLLPFRDNMVVFDYALNYILSGALATTLCYCACRSLTAPRPPAETAIACLAGFLAGANHDGFALPLLAAFGCLALFRRFRLPGRCWAIGLALLAGALVPVTAPAEWSRAAGALGGAPIASSLGVMARFAPAVFLPLLLVPAAVKALRTRRRRSNGETEWPGDALLALLWLFSLGLFLPFGLEARQGWLPGCAALGLMMSAARPLLTRLPARAALAAGSALTAGACALALYIGRWQSVVARNDAEILAALESSPDGTAFIDRVDARDLPWLSLARLANDQGNLSVSYGPLNLNAPRGKVFVVVPSAVRDYSGTEARRLGEGSPVVEFRGHLLLDSVPESFSRGYSAGGYSEAWLTVRYRFSSGFETSRRQRAFRFNLPDGTPMVYIIADGLRHSASGLGDITEARLMDAEPFTHQTGGMRPRAAARLSE